MIVVSNTSPLTNLAAIGQFDLLHRLYSQVHIAEGVWEELNAGGRRWPGRDEVAAADWIERRPVQNRWHSHWNSVRSWCSWINGKAAESSSGWTLVAARTVRRRQQRPSAGGRRAGTTAGLGGAGSRAARHPEARIDLVERMQRLLITPGAPRTGQPGEQQTKTAAGIAAAFSPPPFWARLSWQ